MIECSNRFKELYLDGRAVSAKVFSLYGREQDTLIFDDDSIKEFTFSHSISSDNKFCVGSVAASAIEMTVLSDVAEEHMSDLTESYFSVWFYIEDEENESFERMLVGIFKAEYPEIPEINSSAFITINAYDAFYWLDSDHPATGIILMRDKMGDPFDCDSLIVSVAWVGIDNGYARTTMESYAYPTSGKSYRELLANGAATLGVNLTMREENVSALERSDNPVGSISADECASARIGDCVQYRRVATKLKYLGEEIYYSADSNVPESGGYPSSGDELAKSATIELVPSSMWNADELGSMADVRRVETTLTNMLKKKRMFVSELGNGIGWTRDFEVVGRGLPWIECRDMFLLSYDDGSKQKTCVPNSISIHYNGAISMTMSASADTGDNVQNEYYEPSSATSATALAIEAVEERVDALETSVAVLGNGRYTDNTVTGAGSGAAFENGRMMIVTGRVVITPTAANAATKKSINWGATFAKVPWVNVSPYTSVPGSVHAGFSSPTTTGCDIYLQRSNVAATSIDFIAIGPIGSW